MGKVAVFGSAQVAQTLAKGFLAHGHEVRMGSRSPEKLAGFSDETGIASRALSDAAAWCDFAVLSVLGRGAIEAITAAGPANLAGKLVIDTTNPLSAAPPVDGVLQVFTGPNDSLGEQLQRTHPGVRFVKAFNSVGAAHMVNPKYAGGPPTMFFCGDDAAAKAQVADIIRQFGWEPCDMGTIVGSRALEPLCLLWCIPGFRENKWSHAFHMLWS